MSYRTVMRLLLAPAAFWISAAAADSVIEFQVAQGDRNTVQPVLIKDGKLLVKSAGGDRNLDILYQRTNEHLFLINHKKRRVTPVNDAKIDQIARQAQDLRPLLQGLGEQLQHLSPKQRAKWEKMLGGISMEEIGAAGKTAESTRVSKTGVRKKVAGIACEQMNVLQGQATTAQFCLAKPEALKLAEDDYATIRALIAFTQRLAAKAEGLAGQWGIALPANGIAEMAGVPVEMRDLSAHPEMTMSLSRVSDAGVTDETLSLPENYRTGELKLW